jgi:hypothetical protein
MIDRRLFLAGPAGAWLFGRICLVCARNAEDDGGKEPARKSGAVVGVLKAKGKDWVDVLADGEERARRYVPHWIGGAPKDGGGPDKEMLKVIRGLKVGSRVRLRWEFEERLRVVKVEVLRAGGRKD